jgi:hypothetical protein
MICYEDKRYQIDRGDDGMFVIFDKIAKEDIRWFFTHDEAHAAICYAWDNGKWPWEGEQEEGATCQRP